MPEEAKQLAPGHPLVQAQVAGEIPEPAADRDAVAPRIEPEHAQPAAGRSDQVEQEADRRRLPCAVRAEEAEYLAGLDREVDFGDAAVLPVVLGQLLGADDLGHRREHHTRQAAAATSMRSLPTSAGRFEARAATSFPPDAR